MVPMQDKVDMQTVENGLYLTVLPVLYSLGTRLVLYSKYENTVRDTNTKRDKKKTAFHWQTGSFFVCLSFFSQPDIAQSQTRPGLIA